MTSRRQLAAIMFTDIVGYTALMGENSAKALELVHVNKEIQKPLVEKHHGNWLKEMGDGVLAKFSTALDAVNCALEIQEQARAKLDGKLRIGIHLGDITIEDEDVFGDGVNVASRLEAITDPGGIYISDAVLKAIQGQSDIQVKYLGEIPLKNVSYELRTYAVQGVGLPVPAEVKKKFSEVSGSKRKFPLWAGIGIVIILVTLTFYLYPKFFQKQAVNTVNSDEISIAVLPFKNFSGNPELEPFCDGMTDAVITRLTKLEGINKVISMTSAMSYKKTQKTMPEIASELGVTHILESNFQKSGEQIKITLQLIDGPSDNFYWSNEFIGVWGDIFGIQAEVAENVAKNMGAQISKEEIEVIRKAPTVDIEAYNLYLKGISFQGGYGGYSTQPEKAQEYFKKALEIDPNFTLGYLALGNYYLYRGTWLGDMSVQEATMLASPYIRKAQELDKTLPEVYQASGMLNIFNWKFEEAENQFQKGLEIRNNPWTQMQYCWLLTFIGKFILGSELINEAHQNDPINPAILMWKGWSRFFNGNPEESVQILLAGIELFPKYFENHNKLGMVYLNIGEYQKSIEILEECLKIANQRMPVMLSNLSLSYFNSGQQQKAEDILAELENLYIGGSQGSPAFFAAQIYSGMNQVDSAFVWLEKAYEAHELEMIWLKSEPQFKNLHGDPRYEEMIDRVGFPD